MLNSFKSKTTSDRFQRIELAPNFRALAPKARANVNDVANAIKSTDDPVGLLAEIDAGTATIMEIPIVAVRRRSQAS